MPVRGWPPPYTPSKRRMTPALWAGERLVTSHTLQQVQSFEDVKAAAEARDLVVYVDDFLPCDTYDALQAGAEASWNDKRGVMALTWKTGKRRFGIYPGSAWGLTAAECVKVLPSVWEHAGQGCAPTAGALGQRVMRAYAKSGELLFTPPLHLRSILWRNTIGGRVDLLKAGEYLELVEEDRNGAYLSLCRQIPAGGAVSVSRPTHRAQTGYYRCVVTVRGPIALGPFPCRSLLRDGETVYPVKPGRYPCRLWQGEIADAVEAGCRVEVYEGYEWYRMTDLLADYVEVMDALRRSAPSPLAAGCIKAATVAGLGRFGSRRERESLSLLPSERPWCPNRETTNVYVNTSVSDDCTQQAHVYAYVMSEQRRSLYHRALPRAMQEQLIATNYDAVYHVGKPNPSRLGLGEWKSRILHNVRIDKPRWLVSDEKVSTPGV